MEFDNSFEVPLPPDEAWRTLMDIERIAPCMPGAEVTEMVDARSFKGKVGVRLGPVALSFVGDAKFTEIDDAQHRARVAAQGRDAKGRGGASATVDFRLEPSAGGSKVLVHTDLALSGAVAQYGRGAGMIQDLAARLINQFAESLKAQLATRAPAPSASEAVPVSAATAAAPAASAPPPRPAVPPPPAKPISGLSLLAQVVWAAIRRLFTGSRNFS
jgi:uncharacterized protein